MRNITEMFKSVQNAPQSIWDLSFAPLYTSIVWWVHLCSKQALLLEYLCCVISGLETLQTASLKDTLAHSLLQLALAFNGDIF